MAQPDHDGSHDTILTYAAMAGQHTKDASNATWRPEEGESIAGIVATIPAEVGQNSDSPKVELDCEGAYVLIWLSTVLLQEFKKQRIQIGDTIGMQYFGRTVAEKSGREFKSYAVKVFTRGAATGDAIPF